MDDAGDLLPALVALARHEDDVTRLGAFHRRGDGFTPITDFQHLTALGRPDGPRPGQDRLPDGRGILATGIVVRDDHQVATPGGGLPHHGAFGRVTVATGTDDGDEAAFRARSQRSPRPGYVGRCSRVV